MKRRLWRNAALILLCVSGLCSCSNLATNKSFYEPIRSDVQAGSYAAAADRIEDARHQNAYPEKDRLLYFLDAGFAAHYAGNHPGSNERLEQAESTAEDLFTKSISRAAASLLLNDNTLEYEGEDYEVLYTNLFKALNYLEMEQLDEAFVEIRRANLKLALLDQKYADAGKQLREGLAKSTEKEIPPYEASKVRFNNDAFARYLSMHLYAADGKLDDAAIDLNDLKKAYQTQPYIYTGALPGVMYNKGSNPVLSIVALVGLSPVKESVGLRIRTDKDLKLVQILFENGTAGESEYTHFSFPVEDDYYFKFAVPRIVSRPTIVRRVRVSAGDQTLGELQVLEDIGNVARETFEAKKSLIQFRSAIRAVLKGYTAHKAKQKADTGGIAGWLKKATIDLATDLSENADLRCSQLLPDRILIGDFAIEPGTYDLRIDFLDGAGRLLQSRSLPQYTVKSRGLNLVETVYLN